MRHTDKFGRKWKDIPKNERCPKCGQPDSCGDCNHKPLTIAQAKELGGIVPEKPRGPRMMIAARTPKIAIVVEGGCVQEVRSTDPSVEVILIDNDNSEADEEAERANEADDKKTKDWTVVL